MPYPGLRDTSLLSAVVSFSSGGDNTVISGTANQSIRVYRIMFVADAATNIVFKDGTTALTGTIPLAQYGAFVLDISKDPWFVTSLGNAFVINQSGTANIGGKVDYHKP